MLFGFPPFYVDATKYLDVNLLMTGYIRKETTNTHIIIPSDIIELCLLFYVDTTKYYGQREAQAIYRLIQKGFDPTVKTGYGAWFPKQIPVSEQAKDLMARLMDYDTSKRLNAKEALQHPWILNNGIGIVSKDSKKQRQNNIDDEKDTQEITKELG
eukprot:270314_1